jgi:hypothetical protein
MFAKKQRPTPPSQPFAHSDTCGIVRADPDVRIEWQRIEGRRWQRICECGIEGWSEPEPERVRLDPLDAKTSRHAGQCEFASETDPAVLRMILKVKDGAGGDYWWVDCNACDTAWQVPHYAESVG